MRDDYLVAPKQNKDLLSINDFSGGVDWFTGESVSSLSRAKDSFNFDFSHGTLTEGYGLTAYDVGVSGLKRLWLYRRYDVERGADDDRLLAADGDGNVYELNGGDARKITSVTPGAALSFVNYRLYGRDVVLICSEQDGMVVYDGESVPYRVEGAPAITSLALHYERLFVTVGGEKNAVWFSDDLDPTNWDASLTGGGFIQMTDERGALNKVVSFLGYVYVFRDYGITRITAYGSQTEFSVSNLFVSGARIDPGSVCLCGDRIIFRAGDGLYAFDGVQTARLLPGLDGLFGPHGECCSFYSGGKYYLAFGRADDGEKVGCEAGEHTNDALLVLDADRGTYALGRGYDIISISKAYGEDVIAISSDGRAGKVERCGTFFGEKLLKRWRVPKTDMGTPKVKRVREICIATDHPVSVILRSDEGTKRIEFEGKAGVQRKRVSFFGRRIGYDIETSEDRAEVSRPSLTVTVS